VRGLVPRDQTVKAVYDDDLQELLESLGELKALQRGDLHCAFSGDVITTENLHAVFPHEGKIQFSCSRPDCVQLLMRMVARSAS
jgi:hypothetical protein